MFHWILSGDLGSTPSRTFVPFFLKFFWRWERGGGFLLERGGEGEGAVPRVSGYSRPLLGMCFWIVLFFPTIPSFDPSQPILFPPTQRSSIYLLHWIFSPCGPARYAYNRLPYQKLILLHSHLRPLPLSLLYSTQNRKWIYTLISLLCCGNDITRVRLVRLVIKIKG